jgi:hypothetical protein
VVSRSGVESLQKAYEVPVRIGCGPRKSANARSGRKLHGKWLKKSLDLRNWEAAQKLVRDWENGPGKREDVTVALACDAFICDAFIKDCEARKLSSASLDKYILLVKELKAGFGKRSVASLSLSEMREYRES